MFMYVLMCIHLCRHIHVHYYYVSILMNVLVIILFLTLLKAYSVQKVDGVSQ